MSVHTLRVPGISHARLACMGQGPRAYHARAFSGVDAPYARPPAQVFTLPLSAFWPASIGGGR